MAVNASDVATDRVWFQDVLLVAGASYDFSFYISSWTPSNLANLQVGIELGGQILGSFAAPAAAGVWQLASVSFTAANILPVPQTLTIRDLTAISSGDDFAIDDLVLVRTSVPEPGTLGLLGAGLLGLVFRRKKAA